MSSANFFNAISSRLEVERKKALKSLKKAKKEHSLQRKTLDKHLSALKIRQDKLNVFYSKVNDKLKLTKKSIPVIKFSISADMASQKKLSAEIERLKGIEKKLKKSKYNFVKAKRLQDSHKDRYKYLKKKYNAIDLSELPLVKKRFEEKDSKRKAVESRFLKLKSRVANLSHIDSKQKLLMIDLNRLKHQKEKKNLMKRELRFFVDILKGLEIQEKQLKKVFASLDKEKERLKKKQNKLIKGISIVSLHYNKIRPLKKRIKGVALEKKRIELKRKELKERLDMLDNVKGQSRLIKKELAVLSKQKKEKKKSIEKIVILGKELEEIDRNIKNDLYKLDVVNKKKEYRRQLKKRLKKAKLRLDRQNKVLMPIKSELNILSRARNRRSTLKKQLHELKGKLRNDSKKLEKLMSAVPRLEKLAATKKNHQLIFRDLHRKVIKEKTAYEMLEDKEKKLLSEKKKTADLRKKLSKILDEKKAKKKKVITTLKNIYAQEAKLRQALK